MQEILLSLHAKDWDLIKSGKQTIVIRKSKPLYMHYPFRVIVYITGEIGVVGKFDCNEIIQTIRPEQFAGDGKSCLTETEICKLKTKAALCAWRIKENSVVEYETPIPLERATGLKQPPSTWAYLNRENT